MVFSIKTVPKLNTFSAENGIFSNVKSQEESYNLIIQQTARQMPEIEKKIVLGLIIGYYLLWMLMGLIFYLKPPKKINGLYGYRTTRSMKNQENWHFANKLAAKYMILITQVAFAVALLYFFLFKDTLSFTPVFLPINFLFCFVLLGIIPLVENKLKHFEEKQNSIVV